MGRGDADLRVVVSGDTRALDRSLRASETRLQRFGRNVNAVGGTAGLGGSGVVGLATKSNAAVAAIAALGLGLVKSSKAAQEAEVVMGQTGVAVRQAGLDWAATSSAIEDAANSISRSSGFDDEAVLQSFQVFVRGQKDVAKSLELSSLAADVARGRYTSLESATSLVNKAAMGQVGALRRAGIQIDKNATSVQALDALQRAYSGSAKTYSESAAGGIDRLKVSWDNLLETVGTGAGPATSSTAGFFATLIDGAAGAYEGASKYYQKLLEIERVLGVPGIKKGPIAAPELSAGLFTRPEEGSRGPSTAKAQDRVKQPTLITQIPNRLIAEAQRAELAGNTSALRAVLEKEKEVLRSALSQKGLKPGQVVALQADLLSVSDAVKAIDDQIADDANEKKQAAADAKEKMKAAKVKAVEAIRSQAKAFADQAEAIKAAVLDTFDKKTAKIDNQRNLETAKKALAQARVLGGPESIKLAQQGVFDANRAIQRQQLEDRTFRLKDGPKGPQDVLSVGTVTININGAQSPEQIAKQVIAALSKKSKRTAGTTGGRSPIPRYPS